MFHCYPGKQCKPPELADLRGLVAELYINKSFETETSQ